MVRDSVVVIQVKVVGYDAFGRPTESSGAGSGVIIHEEGYILTCYHVIENASEVYVTLSDGVLYLCIASASKPRFILSQTSRIRVGVTDGELMKAPV